MTLTYWSGCMFVLSIVLCCFGCRLVHSKISRTKPIRVHSCAYSTNHQRPTSRVVHHIDETRQQQNTSLKFVGTQQYHWLQIFDPNSRNYAAIIRKRSKCRGDLANDWVSASVTGNNLWWEEMSKLKWMLLIILRLSCRYNVILICSMWQILTFIQRRVI